MDYASYNTHHSAFGSYSSFILGKAGKGGGFVLSDVKPPQSNVYIGYKRDGQELCMLPFFSDRNTDISSIFGLAENRQDAKKSIEARIFEEKDITRELRWASDCWKAGELEFKILTPFQEVANPEGMKPGEMRQALMPAIYAQVTLDNSNYDRDAKAIFGLEGMGRLISETTQNRMLGGAQDRRTAFAFAYDKDIGENIGSDILGVVAEGGREINRLGNEVVLTMEVPAHTKRTYTLVLATFQDGLITSGYDTRFAYTKCFKDIEDVLDFAFNNRDYYLKMAAARDTELIESGLNEYRRFIVAQASHSYLANSQLMIDSENRYVWLVNEGEYRMMNTFDLTVDQLFWEMRYHPWTVGNTLDLFLEKYSYTDKVKDANGKWCPGGISFTHDMGVANMFTRQGSSSYERENYTGCFSYMTFEQLLNWVLCASVYALKNGNPEWITSRKDIFSECFDSIIARDLNNDGIMDADSSKCGSGSEITTYDSLDVSLGQARNNLYIAVKTWAAYVCLENIFARLKNATYWQRAQDRAIMLVETLNTHFIGGENYIPAVFENNNTSRIIPAIEGLVYPFVINDYDAISSKGRYGKLFDLLKVHLGEVLKPGVCIDGVSGGWKLSSTSRNTWMSKIFLNQFVAERILNMDFHIQAEGWDRVHANWQAASCSELCAVDQVNSENGMDLGSRLYPRLVTSILWLRNKWI